MLNINVTISNKSQLKKNYVGCFWSNSGPFWTRAIGRFGHFSWSTRWLAIYFS